METYPAPQLGDELVLYANTKRNHLNPALHGLVATIVKITPTGLMDLRYTPRDRFNIPRVSRSEPWCTQRGLAAEKAPAYTHGSWVAYHPDTQKAKMALKQGPKVFHGVLDEDVERLDKVIASLRMAACPVEFDMSYKDLQMIEAALREKGPSYAALADKFQQELRAIDFTVKENADRIAVLKETKGKVTW